MAFYVVINIFDGGIIMLKCFSVHDVKSLSFGVPFFAVSDGVATRMISDATNDSNTMLSKHPEDFSLYYIGLFDDVKGIVIPEPIPVHIVAVVALVGDRYREQTSIPFDPAE